MTQFPHRKGHIKGVLATPFATASDSARLRSNSRELGSVPAAQMMGAVGPRWGPLFEPWMSLVSLLGSGLTGRSVLYI